MLQFYVLDLIYSLNGHFPLPMTYITEPRVVVAIDRNYNTVFWCLRADAFSYLELFILVPAINYVTPKWLVFCQVHGIY